MSTRTYANETKSKIVVLKLTKNTSIWYEGLKRKKARQGKRIESWEELKHKLQK